MRKEHAGHGLEAQGKDSISAGGEERAWALDGEHVFYLPSCRNNSHSEDKNLDIKVACFHSRSFHGKDPDELK